MLLTSIGATIILLLIEHGLLGRAIFNVMKKCQPSINEDENEPLDDDVKEIKERINGMAINELREQNLVLQNVSKFYGKFLAVNQVSLEIKQ